MPTYETVVEQYNGFPDQGIVPTIVYSHRALRDYGLTPYGVDVTLRDAAQDIAHGVGVDETHQAVLDTLGRSRLGVQGFIRLATSQIDPYERITKDQYIKRTNIGHAYRLHTSRILRELVDNSAWQSPESVQDILLEHDLPQDYVQRLDTASNLLRPTALASLTRHTAEQILADGGLTEQHIARAALAELEPGQFLDLVADNDVPAIELQRAALKSARNIARSMLRLIQKEGINT